MHCRQGRWSSPPGRGGSPVALRAGEERERTARSSSRSSDALPGLTLATRGVPCGHGAAANTGLTPMSPPHERWPPPRMAVGRHRTALQHRALFWRVLAEPCIQTGTGAAPGTFLGMPGTRRADCDEGGAGAMGWAAGNRARRSRGVMALGAGRPTRGPAPASGDKHQHPQCRPRCGRMELCRSLPCPPRGGQGRASAKEGKST